MDANVGEKEEESGGSCKKAFCRVVRWSPILLIVACAGWCYYAYVYEFCFVLVNIVAIRVLCLLFYHVLLILFFWSYFCTVYTPIARVPEKFRFTDDVSRDLSAVPDSLDKEGKKGAIYAILSKFVSRQEIIVNNWSEEGGLRHCEKCSCIKPDRGHHCRLCDKCMLKYDHHCPWVNTCINFANYKFFVLVLIYAFTLCLFVLLSTSPYFGIYFFRSFRYGIGMATKVNVLCLFFISVIFGAPVTCLLLDHILLIRINQSTPESSRPPRFKYGEELISDDRAYDLGIRHNFREVFGGNAWLWLLPVSSTPGSGTEFKQRSCPTPRSSVIDASSTPNIDESTPNVKESSSTPMV